MLPILDGLDESASIENRRACIAAIDAYSGRGAPHRPFVLTCRARESDEVAPHWVRDDERVVLVGLQTAQIQDKLTEPKLVDDGALALRAGEIARQQAAPLTRTTYPASTAPSAPSSARRPNAVPAASVRAYRDRLEREGPLTGDYRQAPLRAARAARSTRRRRRARGARR